MSAGPNQGLFPGGSRGQTNANVCVPAVISHRHTKGNLRSNWRKKRRRKSNEEEGDTCPAVMRAALQC
ncbi:hypothetical protein Q5P01_009544 [Channa striata]|uniref:Uncharacterized protein n=1 Tax=Channa striata TaxID=64152 RepID=A0AA88N0M7_CHASR|nr:hypothetical protein Q5P01_009544 [Channa striata]